MPSSTSSSDVPVHHVVPTADSRLPAAPYVRVAAVALVVFAAGVAGLEMFWRAQGYTPSITDGEDLWAYHRARVDDAAPETLVILGRSRIHQAFVPEVLGEMAPGWDYVQLAVGGKHPMATLRDIAENTEFAGVVLVSLSVSGLLPETWEQQAPWVDYYHQRWGPISHMNRGINTWLQDRFTVLLPELLLQNALPDVIRGDLEQQWLWTRPDRCQVVHYENVDIAEFTETQLRKITHNMERYVELPGYAAWPQGLDTIHGWVKTIQRRGGHVVFVRAPTSGQYHAVETAHFPREEFWDVFAAESPAYTLHFEDHPVMRDLECAEGTHLNREDSYVFTRALLAWLQQAAILPRDA